MPRLMILIASTRPIRVGERVGAWFVERARAHGGFELDVCDLKELDLPFLDEPEHPSRGEYRHEHTRRWSERVAAADAVALVMPEYNSGYTAPLKNALDFVFSEWSGKPVGFVSYGGIAGGTRAVQLLKPVLLTLEMRPVSAAVAIPFVRQRMADDGSFEPDERLDRAAERTLGALAAELERG